jgi:hypothetical protein
MRVSRKQQRELGLEATRLLRAADRRKRAVASESPAAAAGVAGPPPASGSGLGPAAAAAPRGITHVNTAPGTVIDLNAWHRALHQVTGDMALKFNGATTADLARWAVALRAVAEEMAAPCNQAGGGRQ